ncbi:hypothetical protein ACNSPR_31120 [Klebsiella pneumoniae]
MSDAKPPVKRGGLPAKRGAIFDQIAKAKPKKIIPASPSREELIAAATKPRTPRLVFAIDATASRRPAWEEAQRITDALFEALPGELEIALAVHSGGTVQMFSSFSTDVAHFRDKARGVTCRGGHTKLVSLMRQTLDHQGVKAFLYIGDCFEENSAEAYDLADAMALRGVKAFMFHDDATGGTAHRDIFAEIARRTGGALIDFRSWSQQELREIFAAVAVLAVGGVRLLEQRRKQLPGADKLLRLLPK